MLRSLETQTSKKGRLQNLVILDQKPWTNHFKKVDFWTKYKYSCKSFQSNHCVQKTSPETLFRPPNGQETKKNPQKDEVRVTDKKKILCQGVICT